MVRAGQPLCVATCPLTENDAVRIIGNPRSPNTMETLDRGRATRRKVAHQCRIFWSDDLSLLDGDTSTRAASSRPTK